MTESNRMTANKTELTCISGQPCRTVSGCHCDNCRIFTAYPVFTFEKFRPAFPATGAKAVVHVGTFEENRDSFSPSMVFARDFYAENLAQALEIGERAAEISKAEFLGLTKR